MEEMKPLSLDDMEKVSGGRTKTVTHDGAEVRQQAARSSALLGTQSSGTQVYFCGQVSYNNDDGYSWYQVSAPICGWMKGRDIGI